MKRRRTAGDRSGRQPLASTADLAACQEAAADEQMDLARFAQGIARWDRPLELRSRAAASPDSAAERLAALRDRLVEARGDYLEKRARLDEARERLVSAEVSMADAEPKLREVERLLEERFALALTVVTSGRDDTSAALAVEVTSLLAAAEALQARHPSMTAARRQLPVCEALLWGLADDAANEQLAASVRTATEQLRRQVDELGRELANYACPFPQGDRPVTIAEYAGGTAAPGNDPDSVFRSACHFLGQLDVLWYRIVGRLATIAEDVEISLGLDRLGEPAS